MRSKAELRRIVQSGLDDSMSTLNEVLAGRGLSKLESTVRRLGRGAQLPHWYEGLKKNKTLPNLDGKTIGSVLEMLFVAILEKDLLANTGVGELRINPARGIDLPDLDLGVKSPSENYCTSEPFFSAYERLYGNEHDCVVMLTDYQSAKRKPPLRLQVIDWKYLRGSEVADRSLCSIARTHRRWLLNEDEGRAKRVFRFLAYVNQSDWRAKQLLFLTAGLDKDDAWFAERIELASQDFSKQNRNRERASRPLIPSEDLEALKAVLKVTPRYVGVCDQIDNWVAESQKEAGRAPNDNEWSRLKSGPLDGKIGMSFALQWRYNFSNLFGRSELEQE
jgi:hypothetical protein